MFELSDHHQSQNAKIFVVGIGGGGGNAVEHMLKNMNEKDDVKFICMNTDAQALLRSSAKTLIQLGEKSTKGLGAGANPEVGRQAAEESREKIEELLGGADLVFLTAGMGGGTGTGAAPVVAEIAKKLGILTVAVVTKPFAFEGRKRMELAETGIKELMPYVDSLIVVPNNKLLTVFVGKNITLINAFNAVNNVLLNAVQAIAQLITHPGLINLDFADVVTVMSEKGFAMMGTGASSGENRAREAAEAAISSPLLEEVDFSGAKGVLVNITAGTDLSLNEFEEVGNIMKKMTSELATVVVGTVIDPDMKETLRVTVVATGVDRESTEKGGALKPLKNTRMDGSVDYHQLDRPAYLRGRETTKETNESKEQHLDKEILNIPAFLRRQEE